MTREEALKLLKGGLYGIAEWNRRRDENEEIPTLSDVDLSRINLGEADLSRVCLRRANLSGVDLRGASMKESDLRDAEIWDADLRSCDFTGANLSKAILSHSNLTHAFLVDADLYQADLIRATIWDAICERVRMDAVNLYGADLRNCDFDDARLVGAILTKAVLSNLSLRGVNLTGTTFGDTVIDCTLSDTVGLNETNHILPSTADINKCILKFKDDLPEKFLRGCGLREEEIAYFRSHLGKPIRFFDCFISYSSVDEEFATRLHNDFQDKGIRCWKWNEDARTGKSMWGEIDHAIRRFDKLVLIASESSLKSPYVQDEIERAIQKERQLQQCKSKGELISETDVLFPVRLDDYIIDGWEHERKADVVKKVIADARDWDKDSAKYNKVRDKLIKDLKRA